MSYFDSIVIGAGQSGPSMAAKLAAAGRPTAIIERKLFGGTCVNTGCVPTKALIASARVAHFARRAAEYGVKLPGLVQVDMRAVKARKDAIVALSRDGVEKQMKTTPNLTAIEGHARFVDAHSISVNDVTHSADNFFLNVGARAQIPKIPGLDHVPFLTNSSMMAVDFLPDHLLIIGGSYVALEFGQMYRRFGSQVTIVNRGDRLVAREDPDISAAIQAILEAETILINNGANGIRAASRNGRVELTWDSGSVEGSHLLLATGRMPNTGDLGLDLAGVNTNADGYVEVDDLLRTSVPHIWAMGDCNGRGAFTHTSYNDFEIVAANLFDRDQRRVSDRIPCYNLYTDPPLGRCGLTETQVRSSGRPALMGTRPMTRVGRAVEKGETQGFLKVLVDAESKLILGASLLGVECDEVIHSLLDIMYAKVPYTVVQRAMHIHPTVSELIPTLLGDLKPL